MMMRKEEQQRKRSDTCTVRKQGNYLGAERGGANVIKGNHGREEEGKYDDQYGREEYRALTESNDGRRGLGDGGRVDKLCAPALTTATNANGPWWGGGN